MANASNDDGHPINHRSGKPLGVQNFKPTIVRVSLLRIGEYQLRSDETTHLTAMWRYARQQLNWEILELGRKRKIEIDWSIISAIRIDYSGDKKTLEIEVQQISMMLFRPPRFIDSKLTGILDFTDGQASTYRIHHLEFSNNARLEKSMEPLYMLDSRLKQSTERPFPSLGGPFFLRDISAAPQAPPPPLIDSQLPQHHQIPPNRSNAPLCSSNSNLVDSMSTARQSANGPLPSHEDSQVSGNGNPQSSSSLPRTRTLHDLELKLGHSAPRSGAIHNAGVSSYDLDNKSHPGLASSSNPNLDLVLGPPSSSSHRPTTNDPAGQRPDVGGHNKGNTEQLLIMTSNEPCTSDVDARGGHYGLIDAPLASSPHLEGRSPSSVHGESRHKRVRHT